jgi:AcrR family transcriptional regulator
VAFGKPGRPPEDRLARQREIYLAAVPLLKRDGVRGLAMREVACAACMSIGGLYYYFPTKRALVLYGIQPEALTRFCLDDAGAFVHLAATDRPAYREAFLEQVYRLTAQFMLPAYDAAVEMGVETMLTEIRCVLERSVEGLSAHKRPLLPRMDESGLVAVSAGLHRLLFGALLDRSTTPEQMCRDLDALITGYSAVSGHTTTSEAAESALVKATGTV